jgi:uncharacterized repeat protein (TIGR03917 family)
MAVMRTSTSTTVEFQHGSTVADLIAALADVPPNATITVNHYPGDPREPAYTKITFTWDPSRSDS